MRCRRIHLPHCHLAPGHFHRSHKSSTHVRGRFSCHVSPNANNDVNRKSPHAVKHSSARRRQCLCFVFCCLPGPAIIFVYVLVRFLLEMTSCCLGDDPRPGVSSLEVKSTYKRLLRCVERERISHFPVCGTQH